MARHLRWALGSVAPRPAGSCAADVDAFKTHGSQVQQYNVCVRHIVNVMDHSAAAEGMRDWYRSLLVP